jgi:hypothetical protein
VFKRERESQLKKIEISKFLARKINYFVIKKKSHQHKRKTQRKHILHGGISCYLSGFFGKKYKIKATVYTSPALVDTWNLENKRE